jgi:hypothetical protein
MARSFRRGRPVPVADAFLSNAEIARSGSQHSSDRTIATLHHSEVIVRQMR